MSQIHKGTSMQRLPKRGSLTVVRQMNDFLFFRPPAAKFQRRKSVFFGNFEKKAQDAVAFGKKN
jgi:hypothetical protein